MKMLRQVVQAVSLMTALSASAQQLTIPPVNTVQEIQAFYAALEDKVGPVLDGHRLLRHQITRKLRGDSASDQLTPVALIRMKPGATDAPAFERIFDTFTDNLTLVTLGVDEGHQYYWETNREDMIEAGRTVYRQMIDQDLTCYAGERCAQVVQLHSRFEGDLRYVITLDFEQRTMTHDVQGVSALKQAHIVEPLRFDKATRLLGIDLSEIHRIDDSAWSHDGSAWSDDGSTWSEVIFESSVVLFLLIAVARATVCRSNLTQATRRNFYEAITACHVYRQHAGGLKRRCCR